MSTHTTYKYVGKSGLRVSLPVIGAMSYGDKVWAPWMIAQDQALPILKAAFDRGVNTINTGNIYSNGGSERIIGNFMKQYSIPREQLVISTKARFIVAHNHPEVVTGFGEYLVINKPEYINTGGLSRRALFNQVHASLERLQTSYIDILVVHMADRNTPVEETMKALHDLVESGKVHYIGASNIHLWELASMQAVADKNGWTKFTSIEVEHSLLYRPEEIEMFKYCEHNGLGIFAYSALMDGHLARPVGTETERTKFVAGSILEKPRRDSDKEIIRRVEEIAGKKGWTMAQVALVWSTTKVTSPITGITSVERAEEAALGDRNLTEDEIRYLEEPYEIQGYRF
ncbi:Aldo/keto reductase [Trametopsis cervina]|nr:Aldo/keto reductase [Trametopsis cervina]